MDSGIYPHLAMCEYLALHAVNAGLVKTIVERCPAAAHYESWLNPTRERDPNSGAMDAGTIAHAILLEGNCDRVEVLDPARFPSKTSGETPKGYTNASIRAARDAAYGSGKIPILLEVFAEVNARVDAARAFLDTLEREEPAIHALFQPGGGESETTLIWDDDGITCRARPDRISPDRKLIVDYKTGEGSAEPATWGRTQMIRMGYYTAASFYRRGVKRLFKVEPDYVFLVQENAPPYLCSLVGVDPQGFAIGGAKVDHGLKLWRRCARVGIWPAYPTRVMYPELPAWEVARWEDTEAAGIPYDPGQLFERRYQGEAQQS